MNEVYFKGKLYNFDDPNKGDWKFYTSIDRSCADIAYNNKTHHYIECQNNTIRFDIFTDYDDSIEEFVHNKMWKLINNIDEIPKKLFDVAMVAKQK